MTILSFQFLGVPRFSRAGVPVVVTQAKAVALLLYLAVTHTEQPRERLIDLF